MRANLTMLILAIWALVQFSATALPAEELKTPIEILTDDGRG